MPPLQTKTRRGCRCFDQTARRVPHFSRALCARSGALLVWSGHSCPLPLTLTLILTSLPPVIPPGAGAPAKAEWRACPALPKPERGRGGSRREPPVLLRPWKSGASAPRKISSGTRASARAHLAGGPLANQFARRRSSNYGRSIFSQADIECYVCSITTNLYQVGHPTPPAQNYCDYPTTPSPAPLPLKEEEEKLSGIAPGLNCQVCPRPFNHLSDHRESGLPSLGETGCRQYFSRQICTGLNFRRFHRTTHPNHDSARCYPS